MKASYCSKTQQANECFINAFTLTFHFSGVCIYLRWLRGSTEKGRGFQGMPCTGFSPEPEGSYSCGFPGFPQGRIQPGSHLCNWRPSVSRKDGRGFWATLSKPVKPGGLSTGQRHGLSCSLQGESVRCVKLLWSQWDKTEWVTTSPRGI